MATFSNNGKMNIHLILNSVGGNQHGEEQRRQYKHPPIYISNNSKPRSEERSLNEKIATITLASLCAAPRNDDHSNAVVTTKSFATAALSSSATTKRTSFESFRLHSKNTTPSCIEPNCKEPAYSRNGLCRIHTRHCRVSGCTKIIKSKGLCWRHGGGSLCSMAGCEKGAKAGGLCTAHGGGKKCKVGGCFKSALNKDFCWKHGGGKRCLLCSRQPFKGNGKYCRFHMKLRPAHTKES